MVSKREHEMLSAHNYPFGTRGLGFVPATYTFNGEP